LRPRYLLSIVALVGPKPTVSTSLNFQFSSTITHSCKDRPEVDHQMMETDRLVMRPFEACDRNPFAAMNANPEVMAHFPAPLTRAQSDAMMEQIQASFDERGFGLWAVLERERGAFIGFCGLTIPRFSSHFTPAVEVGWRLRRSAWGHGYATEAARAALEVGFIDMGLDEIVSFTSPHNLRSRRVMERIGMVHDPQGNFDHPGVPVGDPLREHVLYRLVRARYLQGQSPSPSPTAPPR